MPVSPPLFPHLAPPFCLCSFCRGRMDEGVRITIFTMWFSWMVRPKVQITVRVRLFTVYSNVEFTILLPCYPPSSTSMVNFMVRCVYTSTTWAWTVLTQEPAPQKIPCIGWSPLLPFRSHHPTHVKNGTVRCLHDHARCITQQGQNLKEPP